MHVHFSAHAAPTPVRRKTERHQVTNITQKKLRLADGTSRGAKSAATPNELRKTARHQITSSVWAAAPSTETSRRHDNSATACCLHLLFPWGVGFGGAPQVAVCSKTEKGSHRRCLLFQ